MTTERSALANIGRIGFIGVGAVGATLARLLATDGATIYAVAAAHRARAAAVAALLTGDAHAATPAVVVATCDLVVLAVPDDTIAPLAESLSWRPGQAVIHLSGSQAASVLAAAAARGTRTAALHPLMTFPRVPLATPLAPVRARIAGCAWALEAVDPELATQLGLVVAALQGRLVRLAASDRIPYHISAVLASNAVVALLGAATDLWGSFADGGLATDEALAALLPLLRATVDNLAEVGLPNALTGPIARGDVGTLTAHLEWLAAAATPSSTSSVETAARSSDLALLRDAYSALARLTVPLAERKGSLSPEARTRLHALLDALARDATT